MEVDLQYACTRIAPRQPLRLTDAKDAAVMVIWGQVWITQEGDSEDHIVRTGETKRLDRNGLTLIQALEDAAVSIMRTGTDGPVHRASSYDLFTGSPIPYY